MEARRLLSNSIIKIEKSDFEIDISADQQERNMEIEREKVVEQDVVVN